MGHRLKFLFLAALSIFASTGQAQEKPLNGIDSSLTIYVYPPRNELDWSSPRSLAKSFIGIEIPRSLSLNDGVKFISDFKEQGTISSDYRSTMGHAIARVECTLPNGRRYEKWASFSGQNYTDVDVKNVLHDQIGLGVIFYDYVDGHIISGEENVARIAHYNGRLTLKNGRLRNVRPRYMQFEVDARRCAKLAEMVSFFEDFRFPNKAPLASLLARAPENTLYFTNMLDPYDSYLARKSTGRGRVGGGCAPFALALVKMAERYDASFDRHWRFTLPVSERLIGGIPDSSGNTRRVSLPSILFTGLGGSWEHQGYANRFNTFTDPQLMWDFMGSVRSCLAGERGCNGESAAWASQRHGLLQVGQTEVIRHSAEVTQQFGDEAPLVMNNQVEQPVEGFIYRLGR